MLKLFNTAVVRWKTCICFWWKNDPSSLTDWFNCQNWRYKVFSLWLLQECFGCRHSKVSSTNSLQTTTAINPSSFNPECLSALQTVSWLAESHSDREALWEALMVFMQERKQDINICHNVMMTRWCSFLLKKQRYETFRNTVSTLGWGLSSLYVTNIR